VKLGWRHNELAIMTNEVRLATVAHIEFLRDFVVNQEGMPLT